MTAIAACLPYLSLKVPWVAGSRIGIPESSALRRDGNSLMVLNVLGLTVAMDGVVVLLAFSADPALGPAGAVAQVPGERPSARAARIC
ncbi:hypothetical protein AB0C96_32460 [Streptomyces sp. NPDC048506]|uniref:hypothetical protein n=1 Tax=Streptomyces sp. NPDC048506 TaxID=3155028 RepID=UPI00343CB825